MAQILSVGFRPLPQTPPYSQVANVIEPVSNAVLALAVIWYLWRVVMFGRSRGGH